LGLLGVIDEGLDGLGGLGGFEEDAVFVVVGVPVMVVVEEEEVVAGVEGVAEALTWPSLANCLKALAALIDLSFASFTEASKR